MKGKRTNIDFSKHVHTVDVYDSGKGPTIRVDVFGIPNSYTHKFIFTNDGRGLSVRGDFGMWIFCREFVPSEKSSVSDDYWVEKAKIHSTQDPYTWDYDLARKQIENHIADIESYESNSEEVDYLREFLADHNDDYLYFQEYMRGYELYEYNFGCETHRYLECVFDAFDEICRRLGDNN